MSDTEKELAHAAYTAYGEVTGFKNYQGNPMPKFDDLPETIQQAWAAAVKASYTKGWLHGDNGTEPWL